MLGQYCASDSSFIGQVAGGLIAIATFSRTQHFSFMFGGGRRICRIRGVVSGDKILADLPSSQDVKIYKTCRPFQTRFLSPRKRQYSGSLLWDLGVTLLVNKLGPGAGGDYTTARYLNTGSCVHFNDAVSF